MSTPRLIRIVLIDAEALAAGAAAAIPASASKSAPELNPQALVRAKAIRAEANARYRRLPGRRLLVTDATTTATIESFTLLSPGMDAARTVSAANGIWFAICPAGARCPYPARFARPAADFLPRRLALELAVRTFVETSASVVAVSLPTPRFTVLVVERDELTDISALANALRGSPTSQVHLFHVLTRPRVFFGVALEPTPTGGDTLTLYPRWPEEVAG